MRYQVDTLWGSASFDESEYDRALELYETEGVYLKLCKDIFDEGTILRYRIPIKEGSWTTN